MTSREHPDGCLADCPHCGCSRALVAVGVHGWVRAALFNPAGSTYSRASSPKRDPTSASRFCSAPSTRTATSPLSSTYMLESRLSCVIMSLPAQASSTAMCEHNADSNQQRAAKEWVLNLSDRCVCACHIQQLGAVPWAGSVGWACACVVTRWLAAAPAHAGWGGGGKLSLIPETSSGS